MIEAAIMRLVFAAIVTAFLVTDGPAQAATQHDVGVVLAPEDGSVTVTHRLTVTGSEAVGQTHGAQELLLGGFEFLERG